MKLKFLNEDKARKKMEKILKKDLDELPPIPEIAEIEEEKVLNQLFTALRISIDKAKWSKNIEITNKVEQRKKFLKARQQNQSFEPRFKFKEFPYNRKTFVTVLEILEGECEKISDQVLQKRNAKEIDIEQFRAIWEETFEELKLYVKLAANIENKRKWLKISQKIWPKASNQKIEETRQRLEQGFDIQEEEKNLQAKDLKPMWEEELQRLDIDYNVEIRDVPGCFNIPEEQTVVIAKGEEKERYYSESQAKMLTMHELFHVVRGYNGRKICEKADLPPILGIHTPFYDQTEEGGALYREKTTGTDYPQQWKDYHLRLMAAHLLSEEISFQEAAEELIDLGAEPERAFELLCRNREVLRHHIYLNGYQRWENKREKWCLMLGKIDHELAELLKKEVESNGLIDKPPVNAEEVFDFSFD